MVDGSGVRQALEAVIDEAAVPVLQPALFPAEEVAALPVEQDARQTALRSRPGGVRAGAGRPAGALNRRTQAFREYVLARSHGQHPVDGLIEAYSRPVRDLALELGCTPLEAFRAQQDARRVVLEYVEGKMPVRVDLNASLAIPVIFEGIGESAGGPAVEDEWFQPLSDASAGELDKGELDSGS